ncbi:hypothetical protein [Novosphingobium sp. BL-52-GroH]|uniref:hypothetical protein n=1 Tax=Novosphingobium sp. BL-52-GroH TaxID=3349877 RepID=UPI00384D4EC4
MNDMSTTPLQDKLTVYPAKWDIWLDRGWHGVGIDAWAGLYMPGKLSAELLFLKHLGETTGHETDFTGVIRRMQREAVADLIRNQHLLPWTRKRADEHFFVERRGDAVLDLSDREHALPVSQVKSMVLMAVEAGDMELACKRLVFAWLVPTVLCTKTTHKALPNRCTDLSLPYMRYAQVDGAPLELVRIDGRIIDPATYSAGQLLDDLRAIPGLKSVIDSLDGLTLPRGCCEQTYTTHRTSKVTAHLTDAPDCLCNAHI